MTYQNSRKWGLFYNVWRLTMGQSNDYGRKRVWKSGRLLWAKKKECSHEALRKLKGSMSMVVSRNLNVLYSPASEKSTGSPRANVVTWRPTCMDQYHSGWWAWMLTSKYPLTKHDMGHVIDEFVEISFIILCPPGTGRKRSKGWSAAYCVEFGFDVMTL